MENIHNIHSVEILPGSESLCRILDKIEFLGGEAVLCGNYNLEDIVSSTDNGAGEDDDPQQPLEWVICEVKGPTTDGTAPVTSSDQCVKKTTDSSSDAATGGPHETQSSVNSEDTSVTTTGAECDSHNTEGIVRKWHLGDKGRKPKRPCPFCGEWQTRLFRHVTRKHCNEPLVKDMKAQPTQRKKLMEKIRKEGIFKENVRRMEQDSNMPFLREREVGSESNTKVCSKCKGFYSKRKISSHKCVAVDQPDQQPWNGEQQTEGTTSNVAWKKPKRPCLFCGKWQTHLFRHVTRRHPNEPLVKDMKAQPTCTQRKKLMAKIRKEGIFRENVRRMEQDSNMPFLREREVGSGSNTKVCSKCKGFYSRRRIGYHKCVAVDQAVAVADPGNKSRGEAVRRKYRKWTTARKDPKVLEKLRERAKAHVIDGKAVAQEIAKNVQQKCKLLQKYGYEAIFLLGNPQQNHFLSCGTEVGKDYKDKCRLLQQFGSAIRRPIQGSFYQLRQKVLDLFNQKYRESLGIRRRVQYKRIEKGEVEVLGMPEGVPFQKPSTLSLEQMQKILEEAKYLSFREVSEQQTGEQQAENIPIVEESQNSGEMNDESQPEDSTNTHLEEVQQMQEDGNSEGTEDFSALGVLESLASGVAVSELGHIDEEKNPGDSSNSAVDENKQMEEEARRTLTTPVVRQAMQEERGSLALPTPVPNCDSSMTPQLKNALKKFGIKPLAKKRERLHQGHVDQENQPKESSNSGVEENEQMEEDGHIDQEKQLEDSSTSGVEENEQMDEAGHIDQEKQPDDSSNSGVEENKQMEDDGHVDQEKQRDDSSNSGSEENKQMEEAENSAEKEDGIASDVFEAPENRDGDVSDPGVEGQGRPSERGMSTGSEPTTSGKASQQIKRRKRKHADDHIGSKRLTRTTSRVIGKNSKIVTRSAASPREKSESKTSSSSSSTPLKSKQNPGKLKKKPPQKTKPKEYVVEKLLAMERVKGSIFFKVKWGGYPDSWNTWEPEENLPAKMVAAYKKKYFVS